MNALIQRFSVVTGFTLMVALLLLNAAVTRQRVHLLDENQSWVAHTMQVRHSLTQTELLVADAETGQRGYLFTSDPRYLSPYDSARAAIDPQLDDLARLTLDNHRQQANVVELRRLIRLKLDELSETIALSRAGKQAEAKETVLSDRGLMLMRAIRQQVSVMEEEEASLQSKRNAAYERSVRIAVGSIYLATVVAIVGLALLALFILRERQAKERHAQELRAREEWFRVALTSIGDGVIATDPTGAVTFLNPLAESLIGIRLTDAKGRNVEEIFPIFNEYSGKKAENPVTKVMALGIVVGLANHTVLQHTDGRLTPIEDSAAPIRDDRGRTIGVVLVFRDASAQRVTQEMLRKSEKLAAAARLSATVAHEINNPLEAVVNLLFLARTSAGANPELLENLNLAEQELERVAHITRQTLGFYRESNTSSHFEVATVIDPILRLYSNKLAAKEIQLDRSTDGCPLIWGVAGELKQVVANLIANAIDAVPRGGRIAIRCGAAGTSDVPEVKIVIEDNGPGIPSDLLDRIFDPFFTTKKDVGTGLGLWIAKEIVTRHGGSIQIQPTDEESDLKGAAFVIHLPTHQPEAETAHD